LPPLLHRVATGSTAATALLHILTYHFHDPAVITELGLD
jgi:hypothetical protein